MLYVGKAKNLRARLKQYFVPGGDGRFMIPFLVPLIVQIDTIVVLSEKEALLLENNLIKEYKPKYNALLKDDKSYIALKVTNKALWPTVQLVRYRGKPESDGIYFGPYTSAHAAKGTLDLLNRLFPLRQCSDPEFARRTRPCILYDMKRCVAPCVGKCTHEEYERLVDRTVKFLKGQDKAVLKELYEEMHKASDSLEFEKADMILKSIRQIEKTIESQSVDKPLGIDTDVLAIFRQAEEVIVCQLLIREGKLMGSRHYDFANIAQDDTELLETFLVQHYEKKSEFPDEILLGENIENAEEIAEIISAGKKKKPLILTPQRGEKKTLIQIAHSNAKAVFTQQKDQEAIREKTLLEMQDKFKLSRYPRRIECFDISNISGTEPVACMIAFTDGKKESSRYRKYKIKTIEGPNDYGSMLEVMERRYKRAQDQNDLPDLIIVDGGKGHLNIALKVMEKLDIINVDVISIAKEQGRHDKGMTSEQVFLPGLKDPLLLKHTSSILFLLQQIRDEAHRFALAFHRQRRTKSTINTALINIRGIGPAKSRLLLKYFGSVKKLQEASPEELYTLPGLSKDNCKAILEFIQHEKDI